MDKLLIIDGNNLAHRCKHVFSLSNAGDDVSVLYGFLSVLTSYLRNFQPSAMMVAWDGGTPAYRTRLMPSYKATRNHGDPLEYEIFKAQLNKLQTILPSFGVISVQNFGSEADDLMFHASRISNIDDIIIISNDRDMLQAINAKTSVYLPSSKTGGTLVSKTEVEKYIPVRFSSYLDWRAIQGDSSDNIIGVRMVGEQTATKLFQEYGSLTNIMDAASSGKLTAKLGQNIVEFGTERLLNNIQVMSLWKDKTGAKQAIANAVSMWTPFSLAICKKFLFKNAFVSLMQSDVYRLFGNLQNVSLVGTRYPVCKERRNPIGQITT